MPTRIRVSSGVTQGLVIHKVDPAYPPIAKTARVQGTVILRGGDRQGWDHPEPARGQRASALLTGAAMDAVKQWRYRPYILNGDPVEVDTQHRRCISRLRAASL